jgi:DNA repair exonuclease SbcCD ATPase subunit
MSEQSLISRIGNWFKNAGGHREGNGTTPEFIVNNEDGHLNDITADTTLDASPSSMETRSTFLRPWAKRDAAIDNLQGGINAIGELMSGIRDHLERQSKRQDELLGYLAHLPAALEALPESNRVHAEALKTINEQMGRQHEQHNKLGEILEKISQSDGQSIRALDSLQEHVDQLRRHDEAVAENLSHVGDAMEGLGKNTAASAAVLQQLRDNSATRDNEIERILQQQTSRFTTLLVVATLLLIAALIGVGVLGYLFLRTTQQMQ